MATKIVVFGAEGMLGNALVSLCDTQVGVAAIGLDRNACDVTDLDRIKEVCSILRPSVLVNCAAWTNVDGAEANEAEATRTNGFGAGNVARAATSLGVSAVQISSDYVFDGTASRPYPEGAKPNPISAYGRSKLQGELEFREACKKSLIVRTGWLYGHVGTNFIGKILEKGRGGEPIQVVDNQIGSPTYAEDLAEVLLELILMKKTGVVNAVGKGQTSWYGLAGHALELAGIQVELTPTSSATLGLPAPRPAYSALDTTRLAGWIGRELPTWESAVERYLDAESRS